MNSFILGTFIAGVVLGWFAGVWWKGRTSPASVFEEDSEEAEELRAEAGKAVQGRIEKRKNRIMETVRQNGRITNDGVEDLFCISDRTAGRYLSSLVRENKLDKIGKSGRGVYYVAK